MHKIADKEITDALLQGKEVYIVNKQEALERLIKQLKQLNVGEIIWYVEVYKHCELCESKGSVVAVINGEAYNVACPICSDVSRYKRLDNWYRVRSIVLDSYSIFVDSSRVS